MSERLFTLLGVTLAVLLMLWLSGVGTREQGPPLSRPSSRDSGAAGLLGLRRWLESSGIPAKALTRRYTQLAAAAPAASGNLLVIAEPMVWSVRRTERAALREWVERGNQVLLLRSTAQDVAWGYSARGEDDAEEALGMRNVWLFLPDPRAAEKTAQRRPDATLEARQAVCSASSVTRGAIAGATRRLRPVPGREHPLLEGVAEVAVKTPLPVDRAYRATGYANGDGRYWYPLLCDPQRRLPVFIGLRVGDGRVWASDYSEIFSNDNLDRADNARLFANLVALALAPDGAVIFDDMHQGDSELYDPAAFFGDPRFKGTLAFIAGAWLLWLLGSSNRWLPPPPARRIVGSTEFARSVGRFYSRYLKPAEAAQGLFRNFFNDVRARHRLPATGEPAWDALAASRAPDGVRELRVQYARASRGAHVDLVRLRNLLLHVQGSLT